MEQRYAIVLTLAAVGLAAIGGACHKDVCASGDQQSCACPGGTSGVHVCKDDGSGWEACQCGGTTSSSSTSSGTTGGGGDATSSSSGTTTTTDPPPPCALPSDCPAADPACVGLVDNSGKSKFGLRMAQLTFTQPASLTTGIFSTLIAGNVTDHLPKCRLTGAGTFSVLLDFDAAAGTMRLGGAKPVTDPTQGYAFEDEMIVQGGKSLHVQPVTYAGVVPDADGKLSATAGLDVVLPMFLDAGATQVMLFPFRQLRIVNSTLSASHNCIGSYNAEGLLPENSCLPDDKHALFISGGSLDAHLSLEDADTIPFSFLGESLCVLLSGDPATYGYKPVGSSTTLCKRDASNNILFKGNWCTLTNDAATAGCADAMHVSAQYAASSVKITN